MLQQMMKLGDEASAKINNLHSHDKSKPKDLISVSSGNYLEPGKSTTSTGTQMEDEGVSDSEVLEDDFQPVRPVPDKFGNAGTKEAAINWFKATQTDNVMDQKQNKFADWFHGIISRRESERLLTGKIMGCFLIRVSESRFGYTLTFQAETRIRHYMIDQLKNGKFIIIGEPKVHRSLHDLVSYHKKVKLSNWDHLLTVPCGQDHGECDYSELVPKDVYFVLDDQAQPSSPARSQSVQPRRLPPETSSRSGKALSASPNVTGRPLPKVPEDAYNQLMREQDYHKYKAPASQDAKGKGQMSHSRQRPAK